MPDEENAYKVTYLPSFIQRVRQMGERAAVRACGTSRLLCPDKNRHIDKPFRSAILVRYEASR